MAKEILIIDIETTNFLKEGGSIVEVGMVALDLESGVTKIIFDSLCREKILTGRHREPPFGWIFKNSDLTVEEVREAPDFDSLRAEIQSIINAYPLGATAYNRSFDFDFLESRSLSFPKKLPCPMLLCTDICKIPSPYRYKDYKWPKVEEAWDYFFPDHPYDEKHRGADDALHEAKIVYELYKQGQFVV
ncbi:3'-5' exonuclease [Desulfotalea psychrophila]|uniref:Exonuclease domain-containing protein n=1 Tax=Desulfotalea psychrophila (strain LSv54 / DSM 12343) TaxID=177439 RepID=Q6AN28_DESPS|nr:3'-5' exonuclease [Desulfotalea psychrophila]CAG36246.1 unknown protein [Desulfotalea psychrophila LSv54]